VTLVTIFALDWFLLVPLAGLAAREQPSTVRTLASAVLVGGLHSWLMYSLSVYSMHEAAAHRLVFPPNGPITRVLHVVSANLPASRRPEPKQYATSHMIHHAKFGPSTTPSSSTS